MAAGLADTTDTTGKRCYSGPTPLQQTPQGLGLAPCHSVICTAHRPCQAPNVWPPTNWGGGSGSQTIHRPDQLRWACGFGSNGHSTVYTTPPALGRCSTATLQHKCVWGGKTAAVQLKLGIARKELERCSEGGVGSIDCLEWATDRHLSLVEGVQRGQ